MRRFYLLLSFLFVAATLFAKTTVIYHTSDTHGFFYPKGEIGGAAALAAVLQRGPQPYLLLDSGDFAEGTVETQRSKGLKAVWLMNRLGYQAATVGNHEFAFKEEGFENMLREAHFDVLAANLISSANNQYPQRILPYKIFEMNGVKIAVIGLANQHPNGPVQKYHFSKPLAALENALEEIEPQQPAAVVVLVHDSLADDRPGAPSYVGDIARQFGGRVHVVLGGHAHRIFQNEYRNGVLFVESGCNFKNVSKVSIETDDNTGRFVAAKSELIALNVAKTGEEPSVKAYAEFLREEGVDEVIGQTAAALEKHNDNPKHMDFPVDNWVADATCRYAPADVCIHNTGGARVGLPQGEITHRDIIDLYPFDNKVMTVSVSGEFLKRLVTGALVPWNRLAYSGLTVSYKKTKTGKIKEVAIWVRGKRLEEEREYTLSLNSYIVGNGSEGKLFKTLPKDAVKTAGPKMMRQVLEDDFKYGVLIPPQSGRIVQK